MDRNQKEALASQVKDRFGRMTSAVLLDFQGLTVEAVTKLRNEFRKQGVEYRVVKNTLIKQAVKGQPWADAFGKTLVGMTGVAWSYEDPSAAAKVVKAFRKDNEKLKIKGGLVDGQIVAADRVETDLANMPGKDELRAQLLATFAAPLTQFVQLLNAPAQNLVYLLKAKEEKG
ncbi:MAG: 50S ribosomal protein L10 [Polyangiaceae bacterium]